MNSTEQQPKAKVAPARKLISKPRDLVDVYEHKHLALLALSFGERTFEGDQTPTPIAEVVVVDVETEPVRQIASLSISWKRVVPALLLVERSTWQIGRLERDGSAVEFLPPESTFDLERVASQLGTLEQLIAQATALPAGGTDAAQGNVQYSFAVLEAAADDAGV